MNSDCSLPPSLFLSVKAPEGENRATGTLGNGTVVGCLVHQGYYEGVTIVLDREMARIKRENICTVMQFRPGSPMNPAYGEARKISDERLCPRLFYYPRVGLTVPTSLDPRAYLPRILDHSQKYGTASRNKLEVVPRVSASRSFYVLVKRAVFTRL